MVEVVQSPVATFEFTKLRSRWPKFPPELVATEKAVKFEPVIEIAPLKNGPLNAEIAGYPLMAFCVKTGDANAVAVRLFPDLSNHVDSVFPELNVMADRSLASSQREQPGKEVGEKAV